MRTSIPHVFRGAAEHALATLAGAGCQPWVNTPPNVRSKYQVAFIVAGFSLLTCKRNKSGYDSKKLFL